MGIDFCCCSSFCIPDFDVKMLRVPRLLSPALQWDSIQPRGCYHQMRRLQRLTSALGRCAGDTRVIVCGRVSSSRHRVLRLTDGWITQPTAGLSALRLVGRLGNSVTRRATENIRCWQAISLKWPRRFVAPLKCAHSEMKLKQNSLETVLKLFRFSFFSSCGQFYIAYVGLNSLTYMKIFIHQNKR